MDLGSDSRVEALRPHLHWEMVERDTYCALHQMLPAGTRILIDHHAGRPSVATIDEALAVYAQEQITRQATERAVIYRTLKKAKEDDQEGPDRTAAARAGNTSQ